MGLFRNFRRTIGLRLLVVVALFIPLELSLRHFGDYGRTARTVRSERYGWRFLPNQDRAFIHDLSIPEVINDHGFRDRDWGSPPATKDASVFRIAILGNSLTMGSGVRIEETWGRRLEEYVLRHFVAVGDEREVLAMNFAVPAYTFEQMARVYDDDVQAWKPDLVIVPMHPLDARPMDPAADESGELLHRWTVRTATYDYLLRHAIGKWIPVPKPPKSAAQEESERRQAQLTANPFGGENLDLWREVGERLGAMREQVEADGGQLVMFDLPLIERWEPGRNENWTSSQNIFQYWLTVQRNLDPDTNAHWFDPLERFLQAQGPLTEVIRQRGWVAHERGTKAIDESYPHVELCLYLLDDFGHFSALGHETLARIVSDELVGAGLL